MIRPLQPLLQTGESRTVPIEAKQKWNRTGIKLERGSRYMLTATGIWFDASIRSGPEGYRTQRWFFRLSESLRRSPSSDWFALIGGYECAADSVFPIGTGTDLVAARDGELTCYANDLPLFYWNNSGSVELTVTRIG